MKKILFAVLSLFLIFKLCAQQPDKVYMPNIHSVKLFINGNQSSYPIIQLNSMLNMELDFDDLNPSVKNYNYTFVLCDANWIPVDLSPFDFLQGFTQGRISEYRASSIAKTKYIHYQIMLPDKSCMPKLSGNYLLKIYLNGDTSKLAFARRFLVLDNQLSISAKITQPYNAQLFRTHQKVQFTFDKTKLNVLNPQQQLKVVVLQNYRWDNAVTGLQPTFMRGNVFEYSNDNNCVFPGGREYRWFDLRSFTYQSERIDSVNQNVIPFNVVLKPDPQRTNFRYVTYVDLNGSYEISATDVSNPLWQGDYGNVRFTFVPQNPDAFINKKVYLIGELATGNCDNGECEMTYNSEKKVYEKTLLLKQGYYYYTYVTKPANDKMITETQDTEGDFSETENSYTILVYYRSFSDRSDELVGATTIDSRNMIQQ